MTISKTEGAGAATSGAAARPRRAERDVARASFERAAVAVVEGAVSFGEGPPQVSLFKGTQYFGNVLALADVIVEVIYEAISATTFTLRSGRSVAETFGVDELSLGRTWLEAYVTGNPRDENEPSPFWTTLYDFVQVRAGDDEGAIEAFLRVINRQLQFTYDDAGGDAAEAAGDSTFDFLFEFHLRLVAALFADLVDPTSLFGDALSLDDVAEISVFLGRFRTTIAAVLAYSVPELSFRYPLTTEGSESWSLDVEAVVEVHLPEAAADFLTWTMTGKGAEIHLHFDRVVLDDATGLAVVNDHQNNDGQERLPFGGTAGDLTLNDVVVDVTIGGELATAAGLPIGPYHQYRQAYFTQRSTKPCKIESLLDFDLSVGSVDLNLNPTALAALTLFVVGEEDVDSLVEYAINLGIADLDDFGSVGEDIANAFAPLLLDAAALQTHDFFKPFTDEHVTFVYDGLRIEGAGKGIHILNDAPEPTDSSPEWPGPEHIPDDTVDTLPPHDEQDPLPATGTINNFPADALIDAEPPLSNTWNRPPTADHAQSALDNLVLSTDERRRYLAQLDTGRPLPAGQDAAARLWLDGVPPNAITWIRLDDVDRKARLVAGRPVSPRTLASLDRLAVDGTRRPGPFLFATSTRWPSTSDTVALLAPLDTARAETHVPPANEMPDLPLQYELESPLARLKGSAVDSSWVGLSVNVIAVTKALEVLAASDTLGQSGIVLNGDEEITFRVDLQANQPTVRVDLSGINDFRPVVTIYGLTIHTDEDRQPGTYSVACQVAMEAFKPDHGCLPDDAVNPVVYNRSCVAAITGGAISDAAYLDQLLYRHFVHLRFDATSATVIAQTLTAGDHIGNVPADGRLGTTPTPTTDDHFDDDLLTVQELLLRKVVRAILADAFTVPVVFDPYYAQSPVIRSYDTKDGWLNIYESHT